MIKSRGANGKATVTFTLDPKVGAQRAVVVGDFNGWSETTDEMRRDAHGGFTFTRELEAGRSYRFRYLLDGERWENDWSADAYVPNDFGADDSLVDLTALAEGAPPAAKAGAAKDGASARQAGAAKSAGTKTAGTKAATKTATKAAGTKAAGTKAAGTKAAGAKTAGKKAPATQATAKATAKKAVRRSPSGEGGI